MTYEHEGVDGLQKSQPHHLLLHFSMVDNEWVTMRVRCAMARVAANRKEWKRKEGEMEGGRKEARGDFVNRTVGRSPLRFTPTLTNGHLTSHVSPTTQGDRPWAFLLYDQCHFHFCTPPSPFSLPSTCFSFPFARLSLLFPIEYRHIPTPIPH